jgi:cobalt-zinc-cadmium efflux system outer membrane protein
MKAWLWLLLAPLLGCATVDTREAFAPVARTVEQRSGHRVQWVQGTFEDEQVERRLNELLSRELTVDAAVEVALLGNPSLQATYEELGIAQADLVQAGLLSNPVLSGALLLPGGPELPKLELSIAQELLELFTLPLRKKLAAQEVERAQLRVAHEVLSLAAEVREAYFTLLASQSALALQRTLVETSGSSAELARRQQRAGNISELDLVSQEAQYQQARLDVARAEVEVFSQRERMNRLLGAWGRRTAWTLPASLPELPKDDPSLEQLEATAISQRLDLAAARKATQLMEQSLQLARNTRLLGSVEVGAMGEREPDGERLIGPELTLELPLFDQQQASIARLEAQLREARKRQDALAVDIRSEARATRQRLLTARRVAEHYRAVLLPLRERIVAESQLFYNAMLLGVYQLVQVRQEQVNTYREYLESVRDYWIARSDLERVLGGRLSTAAPAPAATSPSETRPTP